jgi:hypothetical protein
MKIEAKVQHAHPECGNGVTWSLELRRGATRQRLRSGIAHGPNIVDVPAIEKIQIFPEDVVSLLIGPRDGNHSCDLTSVDVTLTAVDQTNRVWNLAKDVSSNIQAANPHADGFGNTGIWHFYTENVTSAGPGVVIPEGSVLSQWQSATSDVERQKLADAVQQLLTGNAPADPNSPDGRFYRQVMSLSGPLFRGDWKSSKPTSTENSKSEQENWGLDPALFGRHPNGSSVDAASLCLKAPSALEVKFPADFVEGWEIVTTCVIDPASGHEGTVQVQITPTKPDSATGLVASSVTEINANSQWTDNNRRLQYATPILVSEGSQASRRAERAFETYRNLFPAALCYSRIVPVDEVVTLTLYYREDQHLSRLLLDEREAAKLDRLWSELHFVSHDALTLVDAFKQLMEYATQDADPKVFEPLRKPIDERVAAFRQEMLDAEPRHINQLIDFAADAYRRPLSDKEEKELRNLYRKLREEELPHDEAFRFTLARVLVSPGFLYRIEPLSNGSASAAAVIPVSDWALANRLSYFLWSAPPDAELRSLAAVNRLHEPDVLAAQMKRMMKSDNIRAMATEFGCQWLNVRDFDTHSEKSEQVFPTFAALRSDMYEESVRYFTDLFQRDGSVLELLDSDHTFLNEALAKHYGIPNVTGPEWRRVEGVRKYARGGILTFATTLSKQSGASRTSPVLRGNWVLETLLGEKLPRPPKNVPQLPESESDSELTVRQMVEKHRSIPGCAECHSRIDAFGFSLESFDAIGRFRDKDLAGRPIEVDVELKDGLRFSGETGLKNYILQTRQNDFLKHFCRKLLGYALGRGVQLSDEPLLEEMINQLKKNDYHIGSAIELIVLSKQFRYQRVDAIE